MPLDTGADGMTKAMGMDPLRRDMIAGAVIGFLLIAATFAIFIAGLRQINEARDAQESLDHASRYVQATLRGVGELILAEGASAQVKALQASLKAGDAALDELAGHAAHLAGGHAIKVDEEDGAPEHSVVAAHLIHGSRDVILLLFLLVVLGLCLGTGELNAKGGLVDVIHHLGHELGPSHVEVFSAA